MITQTTHHESKSWTGDLWGGLAAMLVTLPSSVAFGVLIYTAIAPEYIGIGAMAGMIGAAAMGLVAPLTGRTGGLISAPCAPAAAVLTALVVELLDKDSGATITPEQIPALLALTAFLSALLQILYGTLGGGRLIKYIPYPVVSGYLSGVGVLIALGQIPKLLGLPKDASLIKGIITPDLWQGHGLAVGLATILIMVAAPYITKRVPGAIMGLLGGIATYFALAYFYPQLLQLRDNPLIIGPIEASGSFLQAISIRATDVFHIDRAAIAHILIPAATLSVLLSIDTLKTCVVLDALTQSRHNSNRELTGQGIANLAACFTGGMPGAGTMGPTLVNVTSGGRTFRSGLFEGIFAIASILFLGPFIAWLPIGALAGILLVIAFRMIDRNALRLLRHKGGRFDFAVIVAVILVAVTIDLIAASFAGIALAILLFIRDQSRGSVLRRKSYLNQISSKTRRLDAERAILDKKGEQAVFCELQGNLFFGTTDQLYSQIEEDLRTKRYILLDMRRVLSMDYTAAHLIEQMKERLKQRGGSLLFSGMPSALLDQRDFEKYLGELGIVREGGRHAVVSDTLDGALEWMEDRLLEDEGTIVGALDHSLSIGEMELLRDLDQAALQILQTCLVERHVEKGERIFSHKDPADEMYFIRKGQVSVLLPLKGNLQHHVATFGPGDFFGELGFLSSKKRTANVKAKVPTELYVLSRKCFDEHVRASNPGFCADLFEGLAIAISKRLKKTDKELRALQER